MGLVLPEALLTGQLAAACRYETDVRVPFMVYGPGIAPNATLDALVGSHVDLAPTWLELAGVARPSWTDGRSVAPQLLGSSSTGKADAVRRPDAHRPANLAYIEYHGLGPVGAPARLLDSFNNTYRAIRVFGGVDADTDGAPVVQGHRTQDQVVIDAPGSLFSSGNFLYAEWATDFLFEGPLQFHELYDLDEDPWQMHNLYTEYLHTHREQVWQMANMTRRLSGAAELAACEPMSL